MAFQKLVYILESIPDKNYAERLHIKYFQNKGVNVVIAYVASLTRPNYYKKIGLKRSVKFFDLNTKPKIINFIKQQIDKKTVVISELFYDKKNIFIFDEIKKLNIKIGIISKEHTLQKNSSILRILTILLFEPLTFTKLFIQKILYIKRSNLNFDFVFSAGSISENSYKKNSYSKIFKVHHSDYDYFKKKKKFKAIKNYGVFLSPATENPDTFDNNPGEKKGNILNFKNKEYFKNIKKFLTELENYTRSKIIVAQHPKDKHNLERIIGFKCIKGKSVELVKSSKFIFCFDSSSFQFGVIAKKPMFFLTSRNLPQIVHNSIIDRCNYFDKAPIYIEDKLKKNIIKDNLKLNKKKYYKYFREYISNTNKEMYKSESSEIIYKILKRHSFN